MNNNKILVTGCAGFIAFHLIKNLISNNFRVVGIDNLNNYYDVKLKHDRLENLDNDRFKFYKEDIINKEKVNQIVIDNDISCIIHLAAQAGVRYSLENPKAYIDSNIIGFFNILEICKENNIKNLIYASSSSVYGNNQSLPLNENLKTDKQLSMYGTTKKTNELMAYTYSNLYKINMIGLRFFTVYGPWGRPDMALYIFTKLILDNKPIKVFNFGKHSRSFTYVDDIISSISILINKIFNKGIKERYLLFNIGGTQKVNLMDYIHCIEENLKIKSVIEFLPKQVGDVEHTQSSNVFLEKYINYVPKVSIKEGIPKFIEWYKRYYKI